MHQECGEKIFKERILAAAIQPWHVPVLNNKLREALSEAETSWTSLWHRWINGDCKVVFQQATGMGNIARSKRRDSGFRSTDVSSQWTEVRASDGQTTHIPNLPNLEKMMMVDPSVVGMGRKIAEGGQGCIYKAQLYTPMSFKPVPVVVKKFKPFEGISQGYIPEEIRYSKGNCVCKPHGFFLKDNSLCMIMPRFYCDLRAHVDSCMMELQKETPGYNGPPLPKSATYVIWKLAMGIKGLHEIGIAHRDLKASNILVTRYSDKDGKLSPLINVFLSDFETSEGVVGTGFYRAPEVLDYLKTRIPLSKDQWMMADIYSFGMLCYEILTGRIPFDDHRPSDYDLVLNGGRPELLDHVPERMKDMIRRCWHADPSCRPSWTDILQVIMSENSDHPEDGSLEIVGNLIGTLAKPESFDGSSLASHVVKLKEEFVEVMELGASRAKGFANCVYWAEEFIATVEEYASKFDVEWPAISEGQVLCKWSEYAERRKLLSLLRFQAIAFAFLCKLFVPCDVIIDYDDELIEKSIIGFEKLAIHMRDINLSLVASHVPLYAYHPRKEMSLIRRLLCYRAFIIWLLWTEGLGYGYEQERFILEHILQWVNLKDGVEEFILLAGLMVVAFLDTYLYVLALLTFEPMILCLQYGIYKIRPGCNIFMYRSSGYRIWRLQRAWVNYSRYKLLSIALALSLVYLVTSYRWKGFLTWILIPCTLRLTPYWRPTVQLSLQ